MSELISIITPTYNHEKFIGSCIDSVLAQTYPHWEMLIVNDGSTDRTAEVAAEYAAKDARIKVINQANKGIYRLAENYNLALAESKGDLIAVLEGDDIWLPHKLATQVEAMRQQPDAVLCWGCAYSANMDLSEKYELHPKQLAKNIAFYDNSPVCNIYNVLFDDFLPPLTFLIRKSALQQLGGFVQSYKFPAVDLPTLMLLARHGRFIFLNEVLGYWRVHAYQVTKTYGLDILDSGRRIFTDNYKAMTAEQRAVLRFGQKEIDSYYRDAEVISFMRSGRFKLVRGEYASARQDFGKALGMNGLAAPVWKLRAAIGWTLSWFNTDVETLAKWLGRASYKKK